MTDTPEKLAFDREVLDTAVAQLDKTEQQMADALHRVKNMPPGGLHSVWTAPLQTLTMQREQIAKRLGVGTSRLPALKPDKHEAELSRDARKTYRRSRGLEHQLRAHIKSETKALAKREAAHKKRAR